MRKRWVCSDLRENALEHCVHINLEKNVFEPFSTVGICSNSLENLSTYRIFLVVHFCMLYSCSAIHICLIHSVIMCQTLYRMAVSKIVWSNEEKLMSSETSSY